MTYEEIQRRLREAGRLVDQGKVAEADAMIRAMLGKGVTGRDIAANLTEEQRKALRAHSKTASTGKSVHVEQARATLNSMLTDYDRRVSARSPNIYRLGHLFGASDKVFEGLGETVSVPFLVARVDRFFIVSDLPPAKKFIELLKAQPDDASPSGTYLVGWPKSRAKPKKKAKKTANPRRSQTHKDVDFVVEQGLFEATYKDGNEAAAVAIARSISTRGSSVHINVLVRSRAGAKWYGGDDAVSSYDDNPFASVHEEIVVRADSRGRNA